MNDHKNTILAIVLSAIVLIAWQFFVGLPQAEKQRQAQQQQAAQQQQTTPAQPGQPTTTPSPSATPGSVPTAAQAPAPAQSRAAALAASPRIKIDTPNLTGSIALKGARIDDIALTKYRETVDKNSPAIVLLSPSGSADPFYAQFGWTGAAGTTAKLPTADTLWTQAGSGALTVGQPVTLTWNNGEGLTFKRTVAVDDKYLFTIKDEVANSGSAPVTLYPYALVSRHGTPHTLGYYILHEGLIGVMGDKGLQEMTYSKMQDLKPNAQNLKQESFDVTNGWLGFTDKYWAAVLLPNTDAHLKASFSAGTLGKTPTYQTDYLLDAQTIAPGATGTANARLFAGAKEVAVINEYEKKLNLNRFDLMIDWGWFYFITKPMFVVIDYFFRLLGNFGIAILLVTVLIKLVFFPLASKSYASMAKMKAVQPEMTAIRDRYAADKARQQQELMELYKREKINPLAGCLPIVIQIPVFFALYKVLFITIEMRHAPFFGWIHDLSAPDPTNLFTLFGLIPYDPTIIPVVGHFLHLGLWPLIMGVTMWVQMKLNPAPPDPTQAMIFNWMPIIFTFMLASFPAGLVIYWAWNNTLSVIQQAYIMRKNGAKIELFDNIRSTFGKKKAEGS
ncbi:MAG: membrane protein insertase YidC [Xanthobacteraceae bacterium]|uniref:membrane protein insertase YidC n=1 Tax=Pseudolabrys sp. TaxID=1960880 RepID=UPI003D0C9DB8